MSLVLIPSPKFQVVIFSTVLFDKKSTASNILLVKHPNIWNINADFKSVLFVQLSLLTAISMEQLYAMHAELSLGEALLIKR